MSNEILVITESLNGVQAEISYEMVGKARALAGQMNGSVTALTLGDDPSLAGGFASDTTLFVQDAALSYYNPFIYSQVIKAIIEERQPRVVMCGYTSMGMDIASWLSVAADTAHLTYVSDVGVDGDALVITSQLYGGKMLVESIPGGDSVIVSMLAGSASPDDGKGDGSVERISSPVSTAETHVRFTRLIQPEGGDVDITSEDKLVAIGRGIESEDNIELAQELAEALGAEIAASRPLIDAGWLPKTRQVGKSGVAVKPKLYLMLGISGAPEHIEGMRGAELIVAVNTDPSAPIFDVAHYGATCDLFDLAEAMLEKLE